MRISFPNKEHEDTLVGAGDTLIGAAADNTIVVDRGGVAPHHIRLRLSERGIELNIADAQARTHVNTRPVREKAIVRLGDVVSLDTVQFVLKPDRDGDIRTEVPAAVSLTPQPSGAPLNGARILPPRALLRGLSGTHFGKIVALRGRLVIGSGAGADLVLDEPDLAARHASIELVHDAIVLRDLGSGKGSVVNGVAVRDALLHAGDQIAFGRNRFVLEAPGLPLRGVAEAAVAARIAPNVTQTMKAIRMPDPVAAAAQPASESADRDRANRNDIWWLIIAAALIAGLLALLFLVKF
jgi:pSer/pThr/pTyr-binding forkhead associated (FHA) protein